MFVRRGRKVNLRDAPGGPEPITGEPTPPAVPPTPAPVTPVDPKPFDPSTLPPEVQAYLEAERKRIATQEGGKARDTARQTEREATLAKIAEALGLKPAEVDPAQVAQELTQARTEARTAKIDRAVDAAARKAGADEDLVGAVLARKGLLADLDPGAADFADKVAALVKAEVDGNPRLKLDVATPPGGQAPVNGGFGGAPNAAQRPSMLGAIAEFYGGRK